MSKYSKGDIVNVQIIEGTVVDYELYWFILDVDVANSMYYCMLLNYRGNYPGYLDIAQKAQLEVKEFDNKGEIMLKKRTQRKIRKRLVSTL